MTESHTLKDASTFDIADISRHFANELTGTSDYVDRSIVYYEVDTSLQHISDVKIRVLGLSIALCLEGEGTIGIGDRTYGFRKNAMLVLNPNQYIRYLKSNEKVKMRVVGCNLETIETIIPKLTGLLPVVIHNPLESVTILSDEQTESIQAYFDLIQSRLLWQNTPFKKSKVSCILQAMLNEIMEDHFVETDGTEKPRSRKQEILAKFILEVLMNFRQERSVAFYADRLCMTPKHLSAVVKEITMHTASDLIDHYVIMEAKILLKETDFTVQEIATKLNFANQSFFGKYFKHLTGYSPTNYRKETLK